MSEIIGLFALSGTVGFLVLTAIAFATGAPAKNAAAAARTGESAADTAMPIGVHTQYAAASQPEQPLGSTQAAAPASSIESLGLTAMHAANEPFEAVGS